MKIVKCRCRFRIRIWLHRALLVSTTCRVSPALWMDLLANDTSEDSIISSIDVGCYAVVYCDSGPWLVELDLTEMTGPNTE
jgi:hypothetical protein